MCFPFDAIPPDIPPALRARPPIAGGAAGERLTLGSADGTEFSAYLARAEGAVGVVILPDVRGLFRFYEELAERFADAGLPAIAFDYFGRTAGLGPRDAEFDFWPHVEQTTRETVAADVAATAARLRAETAAERFVTVGFCFGGAHSFAQAAAGEAAGVAGFYGSLVPRREGMPSIIDLVPEFACPVLGLFAGADQNITADHVARFESELERHGVGHEIHTYDGAPHSFFDRRQADYAEASADAWERVLGFIGRVSQPKVEA